MRNLKRALSLALATVMTLGLMVVGTGAVGYEDVTSEDNVEAIEVLQAVGIMTGDENGNFNPDNLVTRNEMAVVMSQLLNLNYNYYRGTNPFTDVPSWAAPYVAACAAEGVTSGIGDGLYGGDQNVTAAQAALMILKALGYFQYQADFEGDWQVTTIRQASYINLFDGIDASAEEALTRNQIAQLVLNGLKSNLVEFTGNVGATVGDVVIGHNTQYTARTNAAQKYNSIDVGTTNIAANDQYYVQLGEELYDGDLELSNDAIDDFGRPSRLWSYDGDEIGTYAKVELLREEYTVGVSGQDMYNLLGNAVVKDDDYSLVVYVDGWEYDNVNNDYSDFTKENFTRNNKATMDYTGKGVQTQVYVDTQAEEITVAIINTYLAKASSDYNEKTEKLAIKVYDDATGESKTLLVEDFPGIEDVQEGDFMLVNWADEDQAANKKTVTNIMDVESISDVTVSKFSANGTKVTSMTVDGTKYDAASKLFYEENTLEDYDKGFLTNKTYNIYFDQYGYAIGAELYSGDDQYVFITGYDLENSNTAQLTATANAIFTDGTMQNIKVDVKETNKNIKAYNDDTSNSSDYTLWESGLSAKYNYYRTFTWYSYTLDEDNNVYTLKPVDENNQLITDSNTKVTINSKNVRLDGSNQRVDSQVTGLRAYGNDDSIYITADTDTISTTANGVQEVIDEVTGTYIGIQNVDITSDAISNFGTVFALMDDEQYVIAAVVIGEDNGSSSNYAYIFSGAKSEEKVGSTYYWEFDAVVEGEIQTLQIKTKYSSVISTIKSALVADGSVDNDNIEVRWGEGYLFKLSYDSEGYVVNAEKFKDATTNYIFAYESTAWNTAISDQIIRYMNVGTTSDSDTLVLVANTLYNDDVTNDKGLPLHPDAKFVVAQEEYGRFEKTEYDDIESALDALNDAVTGNDTLEFTGTISAILDNSGRAIWVVFDNRTGLSADKNEGSSNGSIKKVTLDKNGNITFNAGADTSETYEAKLYKYADDTGKYGLIWEGEYKYGDTAKDIDKSWITENGSYYVEIDGVPSNIVRVSGH